MDFVALGTRLIKLREACVVAHDEWHTTRKEVAKEIRRLFMAAWEARFPGVPVSLSVADTRVIVFAVGADKVEVLEGRQWCRFDFDLEKDAGFGVPLEEGDEGPFPIVDLYLFAEQFASQHPGIKVEVVEHQARP
jgi:hypothetical protein